MTTETLVDETPDSARWRDLIAGGNLPYSAILGGGVILHAVNVFVSTTILPSVVAEIGGVAFYSWATTLFVMASILSAALASRLMQRLGPRGAYMAALLLFTAGTLVCAAAPNIGLLNLGRAVQGAGGGFLYALAYMVIRMVFPDRLWPIAIGLITVMWGIATLLGPLLGGVFAEIGAWRLAFLSLLPIVLLVAGLTAAFLPGRTDDPADASPLPWLQLLALVGIVLALSIGGSLSTPAAAAAGGFCAAVCAALLVFAETRAKGRLMPRGGLNPRTAFGALFACVALHLIGMQPETYVPFFLQHLHGQGPLAAGYMGALMALGWTLASITSAHFTGARAAATLRRGPLISFIGMALQVWVLPIPGGEWPVLGIIALGLLMVGFGIGHCWPHLTTQIFRSAPDGQQDLAAGAVTTAQLFATALGAALAGMAVNLGGLGGNSDVADIGSAAFWLFALFLAAPALCSLLAMKTLGRSSR